jgi:hypothetical protein
MVEYASEILDKNIKFLSTIKNRTLPERLYNVIDDEKVLEEVLCRNLMHWTYVNRFIQFKETPYSKVWTEFCSHLEKGDVIKILIKQYNCSWLMYRVFEKKNIEEWLTDKQCSEAERIKIQLYGNYLDSNNSRLELVEKIIRNKIYPPKNIDIGPFFKDKIDERFFELDQLSVCLLNLFYIMDYTFLYNLQNNYRNFNHSDFLSLLKSVFPFDKYRELKTTRDFPKQKRNFHKLLKAWLLTQLENRKEDMDWDDFPEEYTYLFHYADKLVAPEIKKVDEKGEEAKISVGTLFDNESYPYHVFSDARAYQLFDTLAKHSVNQSQLSFIYRNMAEKETPRMILLKDTPFREWFNSQEYSVSLETHTKTFTNAKNEDRIAWYNNVKSLLVSGS